MNVAAPWTPPSWTLFPNKALSFSLSLSLSVGRRNTLSRSTAAERTHPAEREKQRAPYPHFPFGPVPSHAAPETQGKKTHSLSPTHPLPPPSPSVIEKTHCCIPAPFVRVPDAPMPCIYVSYAYICTVTYVLDVVYAYIHAYLMLPCPVV